MIAFDVYFTEARQHISSAQELIDKMFEVAYAESSVDGQEKYQLLNFIEINALLQQFAPLMTILAKRTHDFCAVDKVKEVLSMLKDDENLKEEAEEHFRRIYDGEEGKTSE